MNDQHARPFLWKKWAFFLALFAWVGMIMFLDPTTSGVFVWLGFYGLLEGIIWLGIGWLGESLTLETGVKRKQWRFSRWGGLFGLLILGWLVLQQFRILFWWIGLLWLAFVLLVEFTISSLTETR